MTGAIAEAWGEVARGGWSLGHVHLSSLYPMPGGDGFENDDLFLATPIFPMADGGCVFVSDDVWEFPLIWQRQYETRSASSRRLDFDFDGRGHPPADVVAVLLVVKRVMYLEVFKARKPLGISTLQKRLRIYLKLAAFSLELGKAIRHLEESDILAFVPRLDKSSRKSLVSIYELLRWWKVLSGAAYPMFEPPAPLETIDGTPEELWDATSAEHVGPDFKGVDLDNVRVDDDESDDTDDEVATYKPLPDAFVGPMGEFCIRLLVEVAPVVDACLAEVMGLPTHRRHSAVKHIVATHTWPGGFEIKNMRELRSLSHLCQAALIFLLSLVLGCRWSEISSLPITALQSRGEGAEKTHRLVGPVHKGEQSTAGIIRDWPLSPEFAEFIRRQVNYIKLTEGSTFKFLWRSHKKPWRGRAPLRGSEKSLSALARASGCEALLGGTSFHHHRFRKTTARLVVVALHGGPTILRRLFGHETLTITLRYILVNDFLIEEMREMAAEEERRVAASLLEQRQTLRGGGAEKFREAVDALVASLNVNVPSGRREQANISMEDVLDVLEADGTSFSIKQIVPGLVSCNLPRNQQGMCASVNEPPNLARCDSRCVWHLVGDGYLTQARVNVANALEHMSGNTAGSFAWRYFEGVVHGRLRDFPELAVEFSKNTVFRQVTGMTDGQS